MGSLKLPLEIIIAILTHADFRTILHCRQVGRILCMVICCVVLTSFHSFVPF